jgi:hypothetical protein
MPTELLARIISFLRFFFPLFFEFFYGGLFSDGLPSFRPIGSEGDLDEMEKDHRAQRVAPPTLLGK